MTYLVKTMACLLLVSTTAIAQETTLKPFKGRVDVQGEVAAPARIIDDEWVAVGTKKPTAIQLDYTNLFKGKPSYRFELGEKDNTLSGYAAGETKGRAELCYCYAVENDFKNVSADKYKNAQTMRTVYHYGKGICAQGSSMAYEFSVYIPSTLQKDVSTIFAQW